MTATPETKPLEPTELEEVVIRFAGDSGDGMQLTGDRFTDVSAVFGNDLATMPNYPAEIRAPAGTIAGVSSFQVHISDHDIVTPGDAPERAGGDEPGGAQGQPVGAAARLDDPGELRRVRRAEPHQGGVRRQPARQRFLASYHVVQVPMTSLTLEACKELGVKPRDAERSKNFFALGLISWMYTRPVDPTVEWIESKFSSRPQVRDANIAAFKAGLHFGETAELLEHYQIQPAKLEPGKYRNITGNLAVAYGLIAGAQQANLPILYASYPITPASDILHELSKHKNFGIRTLQAEDEIAAAAVAVGAAFAGQLGITATSGPGLDLKSEALGLAISLELPLVIVDVQRGGPSTGLPTKTEQSDLMLAMYGRHGESPLPIVAAYSPSHCFEAAFEAVRIALKYRTPVILLTDGYVANGSEPWKLPDVEALPDISVPFATEPNHDGEFWPYLRDPETLARPWAIPGTPGLMHRIGGIEKQDGTGNVNYDPANHELMTHIRADKVSGIANDIPPIVVDGDVDADVLVLGWGSTWGPISEAVRRIRAADRPVAHAHLVHLNPFAPNLGEVLAAYPKVLVPEMNMGQLSRLVRAEFLTDTTSLNKVQGLPFSATEIENKILEMLDA